MANIVGYLFNVIDGLFKPKIPKKIKISKKENQVNYRLLSVKEFIIAMEDAIKNKTWYAFDDSDSVCFCMKYKDVYWSGKFKWMSCDDDEYYIQIYKVDIKKCLHCGGVYWKI